MKNVDDFIEALEESTRYDEGAITDYGKSLGKSITNKVSNFFKSKTNNLNLAQNTRDQVNNNADITFARDLTGKINDAIKRIDKLISSNNGGK